MNAIINGPRDIAGPHLESDLVVYFRRDTRPEQMRDFHRTVIGAPGRTPDETVLLPGIAGVLRISSAEGYSGVAIDFGATATPEERAQVRTRIEASSIVVRIFEHAIPNEIRNIETP